MGEVDGAAEAVKREPSHKEPEEANEDKREDDEVEVDFEADEAVEAKREDGKAVEGAKREPQPCQRVCKKYKKGRCTKHICRGRREFEDEEVAADEGVEAKRKDEK